MCRLCCAGAPHEIDAPPARIVEFLPLVFQGTLPQGDVGLQCRWSFGKHIHEFRTNIVGRGFDLREPRKLAALVELDRR